MEAELITAAGLGGVSASPRAATPSPPLSGPSFDAVLQNARSGAEGTFACGGGFPRASDENSSAESAARLPSPAVSDAAQASLRAGDVGAEPANIPQAAPDGGATYPDADFAEAADMAWLRQAGATSSEAGIEIASSCDGAVPSPSASVDDPSRAPVASPEGADAASETGESATTLSPGFEIRVGATFLESVQPDASGQTREGESASIGTIAGTLAPAVDGAAWALDMPSAPPRAGQASAGAASPVVDAKTPSSRPDVAMADALSPADAARAEAQMTAVSGAISLPGLSQADPPVTATEDAPAPDLAAADNAEPPDAATFAPAGAFQAVAGAASSRDAEISGPSGTQETRSGSRDPTLSPARQGAAVAGTSPPAANFTVAEPSSALEAALGPGAQEWGDMTARPFAASPSVTTDPPLLPGARQSQYAPADAASDLKSSLGAAAASALEPEPSADLGGMASSEDGAATRPVSAQASPDRTYADGEVLFSVRASPIWGGAVEGADQWPMSAQPRGSALSATASVAVASDSATTQVENISVTDAAIHMLERAPTPSAREMVSLSDHTNPDAAPNSTGRFMNPIAAEASKSASSELAPPAAPSPATLSVASVAVASDSAMTHVENISVTGAAIHMPERAPTPSARDMVSLSARTNPDAAPNSTGRFMNPIAAEASKSPSSELAPSAAPSPATFPSPVGAAQVVASSYAQVAAKGEATGPVSSEPDLARQSASGSALQVVAPKQLATSDGDTAGPGTTLPEEARRQIVETVVGGGGPGAVEISLSPAELGRVRITLSMQGGALSVSLQAERAATMEMMRRQSDTLTRELREAGYADLTLSFTEMRDARAASSDGSGADADGAPSGGAQGERRDGGMEEKARPGAAAPSPFEPAAAQGEDATAIIRTAADRLDLRI